MNNETLQSDVEIAQALDEHLEERHLRMLDIQGSLEAIGEAIVGGEPQALTEHQQEMVDEFRGQAKDNKNDVYAVADQAALEGFLDATMALARKAVTALSKEIPEQLKVTAKGLGHYVDMADRLRARLLQLRPILEKRDFPYVDVFDYGAYSRFFQMNGKSIGNFSDFRDAMEVQNLATRRAMNASSSYAVVVMERLVKGLQELQAAQEPDAQLFVQMRDAIAWQWALTWKEDITTQHGQTPQVALNEFPERKFTSLAPLLDNRYLVAHEPKNDGRDDPTQITAAVKHYGASIVFDKRADKPTQHSMNVPNVDELLKLLDSTVHILTDMRAFEVVADNSNTFAKEFKRAAEVMGKLVSKSSEPEFYGFVSEYYKLVTAAAQTLHRPYIQVAWLYIRCAMVVLALVELAAIEDDKQRVVATRFFTKQGTEFGNPAMESFQLTQKALKAARRTNVA